MFCHTLVAHKVGHPWVLLSEPTMNEKWKDIEEE
jgi:hypothetical protein